MEYRNNTTGTGALKAKIGYSKGLRTTFFEEYTKEGKLVKGYPELKVKITDDYDQITTCSIALQLSDKSGNVKYYRGDKYLAGDSIQPISSRLTP